MTHQELKAIALSNPKVKAEYDTLKSEFALLRALLVARSQAGLNQVQVAERMGIKLSVVVRLESCLTQGNKYTPSLAMLKRYADAVGCDLDIQLIHRQSMSEGGKTRNCCKQSW